MAENSKRGVYVSRENVEKTELNFAEPTTMVRRRSGRFMIHLVNIGHRIQQGSWKKC